MKRDTINSVYVRLLAWAMIGSQLAILLSCKSAPEVSPQTFQLISSSYSNIDFQNKLPFNHMMNNMVYPQYYHGGGVAIGDLNNDGLPDLYFSANIQADKLYINQGNFEFKDITATTGILHTKSWHRGVSLVDINADGWLDIYVCRSGRLSDGKRANLLYINNQDETFTESAAKFGLNSSSYSTQATFLDYDLDGDLDCFLLNQPIDNAVVNSFKEARSEKSEFGGDQLFRNDNGIFTEVSHEAGIVSNTLSFGLGVATGDLNGDGWPDIHVTNDFTEPDYLYYNNQDGTFSEVIKDKTRHISNFAMGNDIADFNNDGHLDILTVEMAPEDNYTIKTSMSSMNPEQFWRAVDNDMHYQYMYNTLQKNVGNGHFSDIGQLAGISNTGWSWAPLMADFDLDGWKDIFIANGYRRDNSNNDFKRRYKAAQKKFQANAQRDTVAFMTEMISQIPEIKIPNYLFKNNGQLQFENVTTDWGLDQPSYSNGAAYGDLDGDGDLDLVINNIDHEAFIYRNNTIENSGRHYLKVSLSGSKQNPFGVGSKVTLFAGDKTQTQQLFLTRGYQSSVEENLLFGLNKTNKIDSLIVDWPDGKTQTLKDIKVDQTIILYHQEANASDQEIQLAFKPTYTKSLSNSYPLRN